MQLIQNCSSELIAKVITAATTPGLNVYLSTGQVTCESQFRCIDCPFSDRAKDGRRKCHTPTKHDYTIIASDYRYFQITYPELFI